MARPFWNRLFGRPARRSATSATLSPEVLQRVRQLEVRTRGLVESLFSGEYGSIFHGRGLEFSHVRAYQFGDDVRAIDWKVTARRSVPYVRQFVEERDLLVVLVVDVSASGRYGPGDRSAGEVAAEIAAALAFVATRANDRIALILVSDVVERYIPPASGRNHTLRLLATLVAHEARAPRTDLSAAFERIAAGMGGRATVVVIGDFIQDPRDQRFRRSLARVGQMHDLVAVRLASVATAELPDVGWVEMTDPETGRRVVINSGSRRVRNHFRHSINRSQADMAQLLSESGAELVDVTTTADPLAVLADFFRRRQRVTR